MGIARGEIYTELYRDAIDLGDDEEANAIEDYMFDLANEGQIEVTYGEDGYPSFEDIW